MSKNTSNQWIKLINNIVVPLLLLGIVFGALEFWARYKYYHSGYLRGKGFLSRGSSQHLVVFSSGHAV